MRWGILAPGAIAADWADAVHAHTDQRIVAVASRDRDRARAFAGKRSIPSAYGSYEDLLAAPDVDVVYIAAPNSEHVRWARSAIDQGKHVLVEKPLAMTAAEAAELSDDARRRNVFLLEAMWSRFLPHTTIVARLLADGALGDLRSATADFGSRVDVDPMNRVYAPALGGGCLADLGVYASWFVHFALGRATGVRALGTIAPSGVEDHAVVTTQHAGAAVGVASSSLRAESVHRASITGEAGWVEVSPPFWSPSAITVSLGGDVSSWSDPSGIGGRSGLAYVVAAAARHIADGRIEAPEHPMGATIDVLRVLEQARRHLRATASDAPTRLAGSRASATDTFP